MVKIYGRWCGPNWTNNENISARDYLLRGGSFKTRCLDSLDCACRTHDQDCASSSLGCSSAGDTKLLLAASRILANPLQRVVNPRRYIAARLIRDTMIVSRLTRSR
jgi:hypothetical protein